MRFYSKRKMERLLQEARDEVIESLIRGNGVIIYESDLFGTFRVTATVDATNAHSFYGTGDPLAELRRELAGKRERELS